MRNGATRNYYGGIKNNWRRTVHNRIQDMLPVSPSNAVVLYLAGPQDLDRQEFLRRGYKLQNLIAVERDSSLAHSIRTDGKLCIHLDLEDVVASWKKTKIHVVLADLCCGLEISVCRMVKTLIKSEAFNDAVCAFNLLRGRDARSNEIRKLFARDGSKHRGEILTRIYTNELSRYIPTACEILESVTTQQDFDKFDEVFQSVMLSKLSKLQTDGIKAWHDSYPSKSISGSVQWFDSCVFQNKTMRGLHDDVANEALIVTSFCKNKQELNDLLDRKIEIELAVAWNRYKNQPVKFELFKSSFLKTCERYRNDATFELLSATKKLASDIPRSSDIQRMREKSDISTASRQIAAIKATRTRLLQSA